MADATLVVRMERDTGVLARVASMLHRRRIDVRALAVTPANASLSQLVVHARAARSDLERLALAIRNLVDVHEARLEERPGPPAAPAPTLAHGPRPAQAAGAPALDARARMPR
jgi:hypothetical protein